ncbi:hypothetical protein Tco_0062031 [Tanacetum coccineum]
MYSTKKIMGVKSVSVKKLHGYGHMEEIVVKRADRQFYKFKEGDFVDLHLNDIKDMLLLAVQHKLFHLTNSDNVGFSYVHKKSHHQETCRGLIAWCRELSEESQHHSTSTDLSKNRTQRTLHPISLTAKEYNKDMSRRKRTAIDRKRSKLMVELVDKQMHERKIIRNLERLVGARELEMDYKLMTRTT